jgi:hypothetical protein
MKILISQRVLLLSLPSLDANGDPLHCQAAAHQEVTSISPVFLPLPQSEISNFKFEIVFRSSALSPVAATSDFIVVGELAPSFGCTTRPSKPYTKPHLQSPNFLLALMSEYLPNISKTRGPSAPKAAPRIYF